MKLILAVFILLMLMGPVYGQQTAVDLYNKGADLAGQAKYDAAIKAYDGAIKLNPNMFLAWYGKGRALDELGEYDEAIGVNPSEWTKS